MFISFKWVEAEEYGNGGTNWVEVGNDKCLPMTVCNAYPLIEESYRSLCVCRRYTFGAWTELYLLFGF